MTQNSDENAKFQLRENFYGRIRVQNHHIYQKSRVRKGSMQLVHILGSPFFLKMKHLRHFLTINDKKIINNVKNRAVTWQKIFLCSKK